MLWNKLLLKGVVTAVILALLATIVYDQVRLNRSRFSIKWI
ncbi:hypothetical protein [Paenibacillus wynnii]|nr:hypothetical protein [Paenibacillus wynnii]